MSDTITREEATRQVNQPTERTAVELENVQKAIQGILDEIDSRYDGAPDSTTLWMGEYINRLVNALTQLVVFEKSWELCKQAEKALTERVAELEEIVEIARKVVCPIKTEPDPQYIDALMRGEKPKSTATMLQEAEVFFDNWEKLRNIINKKEPQNDHTTDE